ncbi:hypothetical protein GCM10010193_67920 [Kitasatospora atroaurantiaca]|uniref:effector-associated constant component EACC1 n=1 Tax=Kitasatospora atroaurantiaca TaxID=285545 RepID=UPI00336D1668
MSADVIIQIASSPGSEELASLRTWLSRDPAVRRARVQAASINPDDQGGIFELISIILSDIGTIAALAGTIRAWMSSRRTPPQRVNITLPDGSVVSVDLDNDQPGE